MKKQRFTEEQIIGVLKEHEAGTPVSELCRKHGVSDASIYKWKAKYGGNQHGMSERRACKTMGCCRMTIRYETARGDDRDLRERMKPLAHERRGFGYRRLHVLLRREGHLVNHKKLFRLYREEKLTVRKRGGRKRAIGTRAPILIPMAASDRWSLDFVSDQLTDGRQR